MAKTVNRSVLRKLSVSQVITMALNSAIGGDVDKWQRVVRMWTILGQGCGDREACENQLAWAMGYQMVKEDMKK